VKSIDDTEWLSVLPRGRVQEICVSTRTGEVVLLGSPDSTDEESEHAHNCDANGCGQNHVLWRVTPIVARGEVGDV
jgi:hypothetical protein